ncbi:hypothetical protein OIU76_026575 [Salix suchowensis]|nr:hypothetical protein OIU76_026575 [Salix suchowensis]
MFHNRICVFMVVNIVFDSLEEDSSSFETSSSSHENSSDEEDGLSRRRFYRGFIILILGARLHHPHPRSGDGFFNFRISLGGGGDSIPRLRGFDGRWEAKQSSLGKPPLGLP